MAISEANYMLKSAGTEDVHKYEDAAAMSARIQEWLDTPEGSMAHNPSWGHNLGPFRFEPTSKDFETVVEMAIARKLPLDIEDLQLLAVQVERVNLDLVRILIVHQFGPTTLETQL